MGIHGGLELALCKQFPWAPIECEALTWLYSWGTAFPYKFRNRPNLVCSFLSCSIQARKGKLHLGNEPLAYVLVPTTSIVSPRILTYIPASLRVQSISRLAAQPSIGCAYTCTVRRLEPIGTPLRLNVLLRGIRYAPFLLCVDSLYWQITCSHS